MKRRTFLLASSAAALAQAAPDTSVTVLYGDRTVKLDRTRAEKNSSDLWIRKADLERVNGFELKPQGACRNEMCIPVTKAMSQGEWFNLTAFAHKMHQVYLSETASRVWSFGEIPALTGNYATARIAPDFAVADRKGKLVHLSDFRGKKALVVTWASW